MIDFLPPPYEDTLQDARIFAENETSRLRSAGYQPDEACRELARSMRLRVLEGGETWQAVKLALMIEKLSN